MCTVTSSCQRFELPKITSIQFSKRASSNTLKSYLACLSVGTLKVSMQNLMTQDFPFRNFLEKLEPHMFSYQSVTRRDDRSFVRDIKTIHPIFLNCWLWNIVGQLTMLRGEFSSIYMSQKKYVTLALWSAPGSLLPGCHHTLSPDSMLTLPLPSTNTFLVSPTLKWFLITLWHMLFSWLSLPLVVRCSETE